MLVDPQECRNRARFCAERAATSASLEAREKFASLARTWLHLANRLDEHWVLLANNFNQESKLRRDNALVQG